MFPKDNLAWRSAPFTQRDKLWVLAGCQDAYKMKWFRKAGSLKLGKDVISSSWGKHDKRRGPDSIGSSCVNHLSRSVHHRAHSVTSAQATTFATAIRVPICSQIPYSVALSFPGFTGNRVRTSGSVEGKWGATSGCPPCPQWSMYLLGSLTRPRPWLELLQHFSDLSPCHKEPCKKKIPIHPPFSPMKY